jgi:hypothetical protein
MAIAIPEPSPRKPAPSKAATKLLLLLLLGMAGAGQGGGGGGSIGGLFQLIIRWSIIGGGLIGTAAAAITAVTQNFTLIETGVPALDLMITGGLVLLVGFFMIKGLISTISPEAGKFLKV